MIPESRKKYIEEKIPNPFGQMGIKKYEKGRFLGKGGFAMCYKLTCQETKRVYAAKIILKKTLTKTRQKNKVDTQPTNPKLMSEIKIHKALRHPNIVGFEHVFEDDEHVFILLEICRNETLNELLRRRRKVTEKKNPEQVSVDSAEYLAQVLNSPDEVYLVKSNDYSDKYGVGYSLSNGSKGMLFKDKSGIVQKYGSRELFYIERVSDGKDSKGVVVKKF